MNSVLRTQYKFNPILLEAFKLIKNRIDSMTDVKPLSVDPKSRKIYSNLNNILTKFLKSDHKIIFKKNHFTNRIHIEDLVGIILKIIKNKNINGVINATDSFFIDTYELINKLSKKFSLPKPMKISYDDKSIDKNIRSFYKISKKVYSNRLSNDLGYELVYPNIDEFLNSLLIKKMNI